MSKPLGISFGISELGPSLRVTRTPKWENLVYDAIQEAICAGVTVEEFRRAAAEAWKYEQTEQMKADERAWRPKP